MVGVGLAVEVKLLLVVVNSPRPVLSYMNWQVQACSSLDQYWGIALIAKRAVVERALAAVVVCVLSLSRFECCLVWSKVL